MGRPRSYCHGIRCPDCGSNWMSKHGFNQGMQRYRCGDCGRRYQPGGAYHRPGPAVKERALRLYLEGGSLSAIGRVLGYSAQAVSQWVKKGAAGPEPIAGAEPAAPRGQGGLPGGSGDCLG